MDSEATRLQEIQKETEKTVPRFPLWNEVSIVEWRGMEAKASTLTKRSLSTLFYVVILKLKQSSKTLPECSVVSTLQTPAS